MKLSLIKGIYFKHWKLRTMDMLQFYRTIAQIICAYTGVTEYLFAVLSWDRSNNLKIYMA